MIDIIIGFLSFAGALFILLAGIGLVRMPDPYLRISVTTKATTFGVGLTLLALALFFREDPVTMRAVAIILFIFLTAPVSAHLIGRATYIMKVKLWDKSVMDDLEGKYKQNEEEFSGMPPSDGEIDADIQEK